MQVNGGNPVFRAEIMFANPQESDEMGFLLTVHVVYTTKIFCKSYNSYLSASVTTAER